MYIDFLMLKFLFLKKSNNKEYELFHLNFDVFLNFILCLFFLPFIIIIIIIIDDSSLFVLGFLSGYIFDISNLKKKIILWF